MFKLRYRIRNFNKMVQVHNYSFFVRLSKAAKSCITCSATTKSFLQMTVSDKYIFVWKSPPSGKVGQHLVDWSVRNVLVHAVASLTWKSWQRSLSEYQKSTWILLTVYNIWKCDLPRGNVIWSHIPSSWAKQRYLPWGSRPSSPILDIGLISFSVSLVVRGTGYITFFCVYFWRARVCWPLFCLCCPFWLRTQGVAVASRRPPRVYKDNVPLDGVSDGPLVVWGDHDAYPLRVRALLLQIMDPE